MFPLISLTQIISTTFTNCVVFKSALNLPNAKKNDSEVKRSMISPVNSAQFVKTEYFANTSINANKSMLVKNHFYL